MSDELSNERFIFRHVPNRDALWRVVPYKDGKPTVMSYRRAMTLGGWCDEQYGHTKTLANSQRIIFASEPEMVLFVTMWSGVSVEQMDVDKIQPNR